MGLLILIFELGLFFGMNFKGLVKFGILVFMIFAFIFELGVMFFHDLDFFFVINFDGQGHFFDLLDFGTVLGFNSLLECDVFELVLCLFFLDLIEFGLKLFYFIFELMLDFSELFIFFIADFEFGPHLVELILQFRYFPFYYMKFCDSLLKLCGFLMMGADCLLHLKDFFL